MSGVCPVDLGPLDNADMAKGMWKRRDGNVVVFTDAEKRVLRALYCAAGGTVSARELIAEMIGDNRQGGAETADDCLGQVLFRLREKLAGCSHRIVTQHGHGYRLLEIGQGHVIGARRERARIPKRWQGA